MIKKINGQEKKNDVAERVQRSRSLNEVNERIRQSRSLLNEVNELSQLTRSRKKDAALDERGDK